MEDLKEIVRQEVEAVIKKEARAKNRPNDRGVVVPLHKQVPYAPDNIHLSRAEFIAKRKTEKEKALKIAEFAADLNKPKEEVLKVVEEKKEEIKETKPRGRPRKIE